MPVGKPWLLHLGLCDPLHSPPQNTFSWMSQVAVGHASRASKATGSSAGPILAAGLLLASGLWAPRREWQQRSSPHPHPALPGRPVPSLQVQHLPGIQVCSSLDPTPTPVPSTAPATSPIRGPHPPPGCPVSFPSLPSPIPWPPRPPHVPTAPALSVSFSRAESLGATAAPVHTPLHAGEGGSSLGSLGPAGPCSQSCCNKHKDCPPGGSEKATVTPPPPPRQALRGCWPFLSQPSLSLGFLSTVPGPLPFRPVPSHPVPTHPKSSFERGHQGSLGCK